MKTKFDRVLAALADPTRRAILKRVRSKEMCITDLAQPFEMSLNSIGKHVRKLEAANLVRRRRDGRIHYITVNPLAVDRALLDVANLVSSLKR